LTARQLITTVASTRLPPSHNKVSFDYQRDGGYYVEPTVLLCDTDDAEIVQHEVFGPVMTILPFESEEEALSRANSTDYGLAAGVMTKDVMRAHRLSKSLEAGTVWINNWNLSPVEVCINTCSCMSSYKAP
jgi:betaine-aldehyde dehydrogenase